MINVCMSQKSTQHKKEQQAQQIISGITVQEITMGLGITCLNLRSMNALKQIQTEHPPTM